MVCLTYWFNAKILKKGIFGNRKGNKFIKNTKEYYIFKDLINNRLLIPRVTQGEET